MIRVLVADDHSMVREGLRALLSSMEGYELVGAASTGADALREAVLLSPTCSYSTSDFLISMASRSCADLPKAAPSVKILMLTMYDDDESILGAVRAGALGYVQQGADADDLLRAISAVAAGEAIFRTRPGSTRAGGSEHAAGAQLCRADASRTRSARTSRIRLSNRAIAAKLGLSTNTISNHISSIFGKLQVGSRRAEAIVRGALSRTRELEVKRRAIPALRCPSARGVPGR